MQGQSHECKVKPSACGAGYSAEEGHSEYKSKWDRGITVEMTQTTREALWESIPTPWKIIFKKNLIFQSELIVEQQSQSKFAARYYDMDTYWQVFFPQREVELSLTEEEYLRLLALKRLKCGGTKVDSLSTLSNLG